MGGITKPELFQTLLANKQLARRVLSVSVRHANANDPHPVNTEFVEKALTEVIGHVAFPKAAMTEDVVKYAIDIFSEAHDWESRDEVMIVSLARFVQEFHWNPMDLSVCRLAANTNASYICLRNSIGMLALAWQAATYGDDIIMTADAFAKIRVLVKP